MAEHLTSRRSLKWVLLGEFWSDEDIQSWQQTLLTPSKIEIPQNLMNMEKTVHAAWDNCMFALKHIQTTPDQKTMELEFHWLHIRPRGTGLVSLLEMSDLPPNNSSGRGNLKFWNCLTERKICSGDRIVLRTEDPDKFPLPSKELLKMQWHLNRVAALSGASEVLDFHRQEDNPFIVR